MGVAGSHWRIDGPTPGKVGHLHTNPRRLPASPHQGWEIPHKEPLIETGLLFLNQPPGPHPGTCAWTQARFIPSLPGPVSGGSLVGGVVGRGQARGLVWTEKGSVGFTWSVLTRLSGMRLTLIYNKVTFCYGRRQPLAQKVKAVKATQNFNITSRVPPTSRGAPFLPLSSRGGILSVRCLDRIHRGAIIVNRRFQNAVLGCNLKNDRMISVRFQGTPFNITVIQVYAPTSNAEEAEVEWFYEDYKTF